MAMKIQFETDIKGFDRVKQALDDMNKELSLLSDKAINTEKLTEVFGGLSKTLAAPEGLRSAVQNLNTLSRALNELTTHQNNLQKFTKNLGEFGGDLSELTKKMSMSFLDKINIQVDKISSVLSQKIIDVKDLINEVEQLEKTPEAAGVAEKRLQALTKIADIQNIANTLAQAKQSIAETTAMIASAPTQKGGVSPVIASPAGGLQNIGIFLRRFITPAALFAAGSRISEGTIMTPSEEFAQEMTLYGGAFTGQNLGRTVLRQMGYGAEAGILTARERAGLPGYAPYLGFGEGVSSVMNKTDMNAFQSTILLLTRTVSNIFNTIRYGSYERARIAEENTLAQYNQKEQAVLNEAFRMMTERKQGLYGVQAQFGYQAVENLMKNALGVVNIGGKTFAANQTRLMNYLNLALEQGLNISGGISPVLAVAPTAYMMGDRLTSELVRQTRYRRERGGLDHILRTLGQYNNLPVTVRQQMAEYIADQTQQFLGRIDTTQFAAYTGALTTNLIKQQGLSESDASLASRRIEQVQRQQLQNPTFSALMLDSTLRDLLATSGQNIPPVYIAVLKKLIASGRIQDAVNIINTYTGINPDTIRKRISSATSAGINIMQKMITSSNPELAKVFKGQGVDIVADLLNIGTVGTDISKAISQTGMAIAPTTTKAEPIKETMEEALQVKQVIQEKTLMEGTVSLDLFGKQLNAATEQVKIFTDAITLLISSIQRSQVNQRELQELEKRTGISSEIKARAAKYISDQNMSVDAAVKRAKIREEFYDEI